MKVVMVDFMKSIRFECTCACIKGAWHNSFMKLGIERVQVWENMAFLFTVTLSI